ncbi:MAG: AMIN domain-containing protein, partial [Burkholderiaceae bacterium]
MSMSIKGLVKGLLKVTVAGLAVFAVSAGAQNTGEVANAIERVDASQTATGVVLSIEMKNPIQAIPASFSVANPARVALDLPSTVNALGRNMVEINQGDLRSVNIVQAGGRSRVVLNLKRPLSHTISMDGKRVLVALGGATDNSTFHAPVAAGPAATTAAQAAAIPMTSTGGRTLRGIDFRRGADNEGRVVIDLSDPNTNVDIRQQGSTVVVDFLNTTLP